jgi:hypothetical protein
MKEEPKKDQRTLSVNYEPECLDFLINQGLNIEHLFLNSRDRWRLRPKQDFSIIYDLGTDPVYQEFLVRSKFIERYGFAILHRKAIEAMRPYAPLLEIGAGSGYWSYELRKQGIDIIATDNLSGEYGFFNGEVSRRWHHHYTHIEVLDSLSAVRKYPNRNLLFVWPDYDASWAAETLDIFTGQVVIYQGEGYGNACADDRFHKLLDERFWDRESIPMPHFEYSYDKQLLICKQPKTTNERKQQNDKL